MLIGVVITDPRGTRVLNEDSRPTLKSTGPEGGHMYCGSHHLRLFKRWATLISRMAVPLLRKLLRKFVQFLIPEAH